MFGSPAEAGSYRRATRRIYEFRSSGLVGADGRTRTGTACATAPSRQRVYQFHHVGGSRLKPLLQVVSSRVYQFHHVGCSRGSSLSDVLSCAT